jgi:hypothetical protein
VGDAGDIGYLPLSAPTVIEMPATDDDPPFLCRMVPADTWDD